MRLSAGMVSALVVRSLTLLLTHRSENFRRPERTGNTLSCQARSLSWPEGLRVVSSAHIHKIANDIEMVLADGTLLTRRFKRFGPRHSSVLEDGQLPIYTSRTASKRGRRGKMANSVSGRRLVLLLSGLWIVPPATMVLLLLPPTSIQLPAVMVLLAFIAPLPALAYLAPLINRLRSDNAGLQEYIAKLSMQLDTVRYRTARLREELQAADKQARLSHQLTLLGQFTAGFMHEFNNPLAIVAGRLEVLLDERKEDPDLCADLEQMLKETRYMGRIGSTLLQALRRERGGEVFEASDPAATLNDAVAAFRTQAEAGRVVITSEISEAPRVDVPDHVVAEVMRTLLTNALKALEDRPRGEIYVRLDAYRTAGAKVVIRVEDNGPGVPEAIHSHLFEPFITQSSGREHLGLGLFLAASLLDMYDGQIRYETRDGGGARFTVELPPARFTRGQPYHWFASGTSQ